MALILKIAALISIITTFAVATTALVQKIHTAHYVNTLNKNITSTLMFQAAIDTKLKAKINVLKNDLGSRAGYSQFKDFTKNSMS